MWRRPRIDLPTCRRCYCKTATPAAVLCDFCVRTPQTPTRALSLLDILDDDGSTCNSCRALLCPLHTSIEQRTNRTCCSCATLFARDNHDADIDMDGVQQPPPARRRPSINVNVQVQVDSFHCLDDEAEDDEDEDMYEPVTTPLSYRHAFGIEYDDDDDDSDSSSNSNNDDDTYYYDDTHSNNDAQSRLQFITLDEWLRTYMDMSSPVLPGDDVDESAEQAAAAAAAGGGGKRHRLNLPLAQPWKPYTLGPSPLPSSDENNNCSICLESLSSVSAVMQCHPTHMFHQPCIDTWLQTQAHGQVTTPSCPLCNHRFIHTHPARASQEIS